MSTKTILTIINVLVTIALTIYFSFTAEKVQAVMAGLSVGIFMSVLELLYLTEKWHEETLNRILGYIEIDKNIRKYDWASTFFKRVGDMCKQDITHPILNKCIDESISYGIEKAESILFSGKQLKFSGKVEERQRQKWLLFAIEKSKKEVRAVTTFDPDYIDGFWFRSGFSESYKKANIMAAEREIDIKRIFIIPDEIMSKRDLDLFKKIEAIIEHMNKSNSRYLNTYFVQQKTIQDKEAMHNSFLVVDDIFCSASKTILNNPEGHVFIGKNKEIYDLKELFDGLMLVAEPANSYKFSSVSPVLN